ncbi:MAG: divergent polysaccharide deacetylase family protein [Zavarzinia sp.]|nr:divergent polysaccharide deacetylase family protein [Zavarzinia sp.]
MARHGIRPRRRGGRRVRTGLLGRPGVRRAIVGVWAVVVAAAVGFLSMRAFDEHRFVPRQPAPASPAPIAAPAATGRPAAVATAPAPALPPAARAPLGIASPVEGPRESAAVIPPPPPVTAEDAPYDGRPAWQRYAITAPAFDRKPAIAIVIDDVGVAKGELDALLALEAPVTLSVMGYADRMDGFERKARSAGHELMLHVPMEPTGKADPGPHALTVGLAPAEILKRLRWHLDRHDGYVGVNNHMGSRFTADAAGMAVVTAELKERGLLFLDSRTSADSVGEAEAKAAGIPTAARDVFLDNEIGANAIEAQLVLTERRARESGTAIAIGHPHALTIEALARFIPQAKARGVVFVPLSAVVARRSGLPLPGSARGAAPAPQPPRPAAAATPLPSPKPKPTPAAGSTDDGATRSGSLPPPRG